ncbi:MAG: hypothetical protein HY269_09815, partial [Deltaproteobacteria bacterium]|nr:hypothetical protein [Deltaproteobacteria bacterium]
MIRSLLQRTFVLGVTAVLPTAALAGENQRCFVVTDEFGTRLVSEYAQGSDFSGTLGRSTGIIWQYADPVAIAQNVALAPGVNTAWVAQDLNNQRLQHFSITGNGTPLGEAPLTPTNFFTTVTASHGADLAASVYQPPTGYYMQVWNSSSGTPLWNYSFSSYYNSMSYYGVKISRDGSRVCALLMHYEQPDPNLPPTYFSDLHIFDGAGNLLRHWTINTYADCIDLNDDGSLCLVTQGSSGLLIDTNTAQQIFSAPGSGGGARHKISGNGNVLVLGGFGMQAYKKIGGVYTLVINYNAPTSWFGWGAAVSRDGKTVAALAHDYGSNYTHTATRAWDVDSGALLGTYETFAETATFQDAAWGGNVSDDGSVIVVSSWGAADNNHPETMMFDRSVHLIGSIDSPGSPFGQDLSGDGVYALVGTKSVHANTFGNGGITYSYKVKEACITGDVNCDCIVNLSDLAALLA